MRTHTQQMRSPIADKPPSRAHHSGVTLFIATLTILIALVAIAPLNGIGQPSGQSPHPGNRLRAKRSVSGSSQPSSPLFLPAVTYLSGGFGATSVTVADVNGDGKPDLVVAKACGSSCAEGSTSVLLGRGDGTFQLSVVYESGGSIAYSVAVADVNGDGKPDLVVANCGPIGINACQSGNGLVGVLLGNGNGTFRPVVTYDSGGSTAVSVAVADVNGDGKPDVLVANECGTSSTCQPGAWVSYWEMATVPFRQRRPMTQNMPLSRWQSQM